MEVRERVTSLLLSELQSGQSSFLTPGFILAFQSFQQKCSEGNVKNVRNAKAKCDLG